MRLVSVVAEALARALDGGLPGAGPTIDLVGHEVLGQWKQGAFRD